MANDKGYANYVANFEQLVEHIVAMGMDYDPKMNEIKLPQLQAALVKAKAAIKDVQTEVSEYNKAVDERIMAFADIRKYATRIMAALTSSDVYPEVIRSARSINNKIQGAARKTEPAPALSVGAATVGEDQQDANTSIAPAKHHSTSQRSYDQMIEHFGALAELLSQESNYDPNETLLKTSGLKGVISKLAGVNTTVKQSYAAVNNARILRNKMLQAPKDSVASLSAATKNYIKALYGAASPQFKTVAKLSFPTVDKAL